MTTAPATTTEAAPAEASLPTIELLGQADAGGCCGGGSCGI